MRKLNEHCFGSTQILFESWANNLVSMLSSAVQVYASLQMHVKCIVADPARFKIELLSSHLYELCTHLTSDAE